MPILPATQDVQIVGEVQVKQFGGQIAEDENQSNNQSPYKWNNFCPASLPGINT
jgi:hypothetical protein